MMTVTTTSNSNRTATTNYKRADLIRALRALSVERNASSRLVLILKDCKKVKSLIPAFENYLKVWDLKVTNCLKHELDGTLELSVNARQVAEVKWVTNLAYDFFKTAVIGHAKK